MIYLVTDFGINGPYLGQMISVFARTIPHIPIINLLSDAPRFDPIRTAYLLAAYTQGLEIGDIVLGVVDPGVGGDRAGVILNADGIWYIGPDNGLFELVSDRAKNPRWWMLPPPAESASISFHGRDWFAPCAADLASGLWSPKSAGSHTPPSGGHNLAPQCAEVIYIDYYGNSMTGLSGSDLPHTATLAVDNQHTINWARNFSAVKPGTPFWYVNANGLVEVAANRSRVCDVLGLGIGTPVELVV